MRVAQCGCSVLLAGYLVGATQVPGSAHQSLQPTEWASESVSRFLINLTDLAKEQMQKISLNQTSPAPKQAQLYLFPTLDEMAIPRRKPRRHSREASSGGSSARQGDAELDRSLQLKLQDAVYRLVDEGEWTNVTRSNGKKMPIFVMPTAKVERELRELNDPTLTQALLGTTLRQARVRRARGTPTTPRI